MPIFTDFSAATSQYFSSAVTEVTNGMWSPGETGSLLAIFTSSVQVASAGEYYYDLYHLNPTTNLTDAEVQFSVAYGHRLGSGSPANTATNPSTVPTQVIYNQYANILLPSSSKFKFGANERDDIYVINISRARMKQALDPGNWQLALSGSRGVVKLIDSSSATTTLSGNTLAAQSFEIRSGSIESSTTVLNTADTRVYGIVYPDYGIIVLDPTAVSESVGFVNPAENNRTLTAFPFAPYTGSVTTYQYDHEGLSRSISRAMAVGNAFIARSVEKVASTTYFIYVKPDDYNYSNNPTYGNIVDGNKTPYDSLGQQKLTYITTVGLYNSTNELVAVGKLSRPLEKKPDRAALLRVRLDY